MREQKPAKPHRDLMVLEPGAPSIVVLRLLLASQYLAEVEWTGDPRYPKITADSRSLVI